MIKLGLKNTAILSLLNKIPVLKYFFVLKISQKSVEIQNQAVLNKFYTDIFVDSKISKKTVAGRFSDLDKISLKYLRYKAIIHDVAVSNGITSVDLFEILEKNKLEFNFYVSDKYAEFYVKTGFVTRVFDLGKNLVFGYWGMFFGVDHNLNFPLTMWLFRQLQKMKIPDEFDYKVLLFHPKLLNLIRQKKLEYIDYDVLFTRIEKDFTFVRCMNILNLGYFKLNELTKAINNIFDSLKEKGILLVGRTLKNGVSNASFFIKKEHNFELLEDVNNGSEVKQIILKYEKKN